MNKEFEAKFNELDLGHKKVLICTIKDADDATIDDMQHALKHDALQYIVCDDRFKFYTIDADYKLVIVKHEEETDCEIDDDTTSLKRLKNWFNKVFYKRQ